jgi:hypothetical protein
MYGCREDMFTRSQITAILAKYLPAPAVTGEDMDVRYYAALEEYKALISGYDDHWITPDSEGGFEAGWEAAIRAANLTVADEGRKP